MQLCWHALLVVSASVSTAGGVRLQDSVESGTIQECYESPETEWHVFVKRVHLAGNLQYVKGGAFFHTETMLCPSPFSECVKKNKPSYHIGFGPSYFHRFLEKYQLQANSTYTPLPEQSVRQLSRQWNTFEENYPCVVIGYRGIGPYTSAFDDTEPFFFAGAHGDQELFYLGAKVFDLEHFLSKMQECGNWEDGYYHLLYHNCNYFTNAVAMALGMPTPTIQGEALAGSPWIPWPGYWEVDQGREGRCMGTKCIGEHTDDRYFRRGVCNEGICHDGSEYSPEFHSCSSHPSSKSPATMEVKIDEAIELSIKAYAATQEAWNSERMRVVRSEGAAAITFASKLIASKVQEIFAGLSQKSVDTDGGNE